MASDTAIVRDPLARGVSVGDAIAGKYRVERVIGRGGMSLVVEATHMQLGHRFALKLLSRGLSNADAFERIVAEARAAAQIHSDHAVRVFDLGTTDAGEPYIVMELLVGSDLRQRLARLGPVPYKDAAYWVLQACDALADAHARGIVHRDLKPGNMFLTRRGDGGARIKVVDFGLASQAVDPPQRVLSGSPGYAAPEQLRRGAPVDARADVWALGVVLYELVSGKLPWDVRTLGEMRAATSERPPAPLEPAQGPVPPELEAIIMRCLQPSPAQRFANVGELAASLVPLGPAEGRVYLRRISAALAGTRAQRSSVEVTGTTLTGSEHFSLDVRASLMSEESDPGAHTSVLDARSTHEPSAGAAEGPQLIAEVVPARRFRTLRYVAAAIAVPLMIVIGWRSFGPSAHARGAPGNESTIARTESTIAPTESSLPSASLPVAVTAPPLPPAAPSPLVTAAPSTSQAGRPKLSAKVHAATHATHRPEPSQQGAAPPPAPHPTTISRPDPLTYR